MMVRCIFLSKLKWFRILDEHFGYSCKGGKFRTLGGSCEQ